VPLASELADLWLAVIFWGGAVGYTAGLAGALVAFILRVFGFRRVWEERNPYGETRLVAGPRISVLDLGGKWGFVGGLIGGVMGFIIHYENRLPPG
jgi:hypothetical protein